jgi:NADPH:quinone reductase-like Zn-dependent oxidoreductase
LKAIVYETNGTADVLEYRDLPDPVPGAREVLIKTAYISIEGGDILNRRLVPPPHTPFIPGYQVAGTIIGLGADVTGLQLGQPVTAFNWHGSHAELFCTRASYVYPVPASMDMALASTIPVAFGTAHDALFEFGKLQPGETILIQGAAGGVGIAAVQLAKQAGARVIGTSSSDARLQRLVGFGLDIGINHTSDNIAERCLAATQGRGVDMVLDLAGGAAVTQLLEAIAYRGRYAIVGAATGDLPRFEFFDLIRKSLTVFGTSFGREMHTPRAHTIIHELIAQVSAGTLSMPIEAVFPLQDARAAHRCVEQGHPFGRVLLQP